MSEPVAIARELLFPSLRDHAICTSSRQWMTDEFVLSPDVKLNKIYSIHP